MKVCLRAPRGRRPVVLLVEFGDDEVAGAAQSTQELAFQVASDGDDSDDGDDSNSDSGQTNTTEEPNDGTATPAAEGGEDESGPGFGVLTGAAAVLGSTLVWLRNRDKDDE